MMSVRVGLVGAGTMGSQHAEILVKDVPGCDLIAIADADVERAKAVALRTNIKSLERNGFSIANRKDVDAVLIASPDDTHSELVQACIRLGKPVLCEKPLAPSSTECRAIIDLEMRAKRRLVQVGFMRRFDPGYRAMKDALQLGDLGDGVFMHCVHRIAKAPTYFTTEVIPFASAVHEIDSARYVTSDEVVQVEVRKARPSKLAPGRHPLLFLFQMASGMLVDVEIFSDAQYGYDVQAELVLEKGTVSLAAPSVANFQRDGVCGKELEIDWSRRFERAYVDQAKAWITSISTGDPNAGASTWDGYIATRIAEASVAALKNEEGITTDVERIPKFYQAK